MDWLTIDDDNAKTVSGVNGDKLYYTVSENTTGARRTGRITIQSDEGITTLKFVQSPYASKSTSK